MAKILITNGGPHPPEKWAMTTAERIFDVSSLAGDRLIQAQKFQLSIAEVLMPHHDKIQGNERSKMNENIDSMLVPYNIADDIENSMKDILAVAKGTPWEKHFADPAVQAAVREVLASHLATVVHIERLWHADQHPEAPQSHSYYEAMR